MSMQDAVRTLMDELRDERNDNVGGDDAMGAWFLGPKAEGQPLLDKLIEDALREVACTRRSTYRGDPPWADPASPAYAREAERIARYLGDLMGRLSRYSIPWYSYRYQGHMNWDVSLPAVAGYFGAMLYNQNNAAAEGGPVTTAIELSVASELCELIGFSHRDGLHPWGHITCGGSVANIEALWAARNLRLYPFVIRWILEEDDQLRRARGITVTHADGETSELLESGWWQLLNLGAGEVFDIPARLVDDYEFEKEWLDSRLSAMDEVSVQHLGIGRFARFIDGRFGAGGKLRERIESMAVMAPASIHYSVPKATTLLGLGTDGVVPVKIGEDGRMDTTDLRTLLEQRLADQLPVMAVVAVLGTTQESAVDDLAAVLEIRDDLRGEGMDFPVHADAAWGGYFTALLREPRGEASRRLLRAAGEAVDFDPGFRPGEAGPGGALALKQLEIAGEECDKEKEAPPPHERLVMTPEIGLKAHVAEQLTVLHRADSVTLDPHKSGFVPYPAGAICYRDGRTAEMIRITAPIVYHEGTAETVGVFGIEGSKPGAAPAAVHMSHRVIRPDQGGIGKVLGRCTFNARRFFLELATMESALFEIATLEPLEAPELRMIRGERWCDLTNSQLWEKFRDDVTQEAVFRKVGPDLNINTFALNPWIPDDRGELVRNPDPRRADAFNLRVFRALSLEFEGDERPPVVITGSRYEGESARAPAARLRRALGFPESSALPIDFLIATTMNPWMSDADGGHRNMVREVAAHMKQAIEDEVRAFWRELSEVEP